MGRRNNNSLISACFELATAMPWWLGFLLAAVTYEALHYFAVQELPVTHAADPLKDLTPMLTGTIVKSFASVLQYLLPMALILGVLVSLIKKIKSRRLFTAAVAEPNNIANMSWREFEDLICEVFRRQGYQVVQKGGSGSDGGIDLVLIKGADRVLVQCKHWKKGKVGVTVVRELLGVVTAAKACAGIVVASENFTQEAQAFAKGNNITLIGGPELAMLFAQARDASNAEHSVAGVGNPSCPQCGADMRRRTAKRGERAGQMFWGCARFPVCKGTINC